MRRRRLDHPIVGCVVAYVSDGPRTSGLVEAAFSSKVARDKVGTLRVRGLGRWPNELPPPGTWERKLAHLTGVLREVPMSAVVSVELPPPDHPFTVTAEEFHEWVAAQVDPSPETK